MLKLLSYLHFCPARFYFNVTQAIERLEALGEKGVDAKGKEIKFGIIRPNDVGFVELVQVLKENKVWGGETQSVMLVENEAALTVGDYSTKVVRALVVRGNSKQEILQTNPFDPTQPIRELKDWAEAITRKRVARWLVILILLYMIAGIYLVLTT